MFIIIIFLFGLLSRVVFLEDNLFENCIIARDDDLLRHEHRSAVACNLGDFCRLKSSSCREFRQSVNQTWVMLIK